MNNSSPTIRLDSFLSSNGYCSRRAVGSFLTTNSVTVDGEKVTEPGLRISPEKDTILINDKPLTSVQLIYYLLYKPKGYISTASDEQGRKTVLDLVKSSIRVYPVGRLDKESTGLLLLTNDGDLANKLIHPRFHVPKTYEVLISGYVPEFKLQKLRSGVKLEDGITQPAEVKIISQTNRKAVLEIVLYEGKKRQIRRMCEALDLDLLELKRIKFGPLTIGKLQPGNFRLLRKEEIQLLKNSVEKLK